MAMQFESKTNLGELTDSPIGTTLTVPSGSILVVHITSIYSGVGSERAGGAPTFGGSALTAILGTPLFNGVTGFTELWYHLTPTSTPDSTLSIPNTGTEKVTAKTSIYSSSTGVAELADYATNVATSNAPSVTSPAPGADGAVHVDSMFHGWSSLGAFTNNRTLLYSLVASSRINMCQYYEQTTNASASMEYTTFGASAYAVIAASFIETTPATTYIPQPIYYK